MKVEDKTLFLKPILGKSASKASQKPAFSSNTLRITNNTPQEGFKRNITLAAKKYTFSFFMDKGLEDLNDKEYFSVDIINSSNAIVYTYTTKVNTTGYYNFEYSATTAGTYTWRFRRVSLNGRSSSGIAYFDDFKASYTIQQSQQVCSSPKNYRFGFNTQEKDDEVYGAGNLNTALFWEYDTRIGRRWNLDPKGTVGISDYAVNDNNPVLKYDINGDCPWCVVLAGFLLAPEVFKNSTGNVKGDMQAIQNAEKIKEGMIATSILGGAGMIRGGFFKQVMGQALTAGSAQFVASWYKAEKKGEKFNAEKVITNTFKNLDAFDAVVGTLNYGLLTKAALAATVDISPTEAKAIGYDKSMGAFTVDLSMNLIGAKIGQNIDKSWNYPNSPAANTMNNILQKTNEAANTAISDELKNQLGEKNYNSLKLKNSLELSKPEPMKSDNTRSVRY